MKLKNSLARAFLFIVSIAFEQSPGGISADLSSWFKPDANITMNNANKISQWQSTDGVVELNYTMT